jgi:hypothetical protein
MEPVFDLRIAGTGNKLINLRYLAAVLRVADILEFDPERTPDVVFAHRAVSPQSHIYWYKDHAIVLSVEKDSSNIIITARTKDAWMHRAILDTADSVDAELQNCTAIEKQNGFVHGVKLDSITYYRWPWPPQSSRDIKPQNNTFEYIEGAFRPDTRRVISLLAGTRLYDSPLAAINSGTITERI